MEPALADGDWLVLGRSDPRAGDLVVLREPGNGGLAVKRIAALPGENVQIVGSDLWVDGGLRTRDLAGIEDLVPMLDALGVAIGNEFDLLQGGFAAREGGWRLASGAAQVYLKRPPLAGYLLRGIPVPGAVPAADLGLEVAYALPAPESALLLHLRLGRSLFTAVLADSGRTAHVLRREPEGGETLLAEVTLDPPAPRGCLFFSIADRRLTLTAGARRLVAGVRFAPPEPLSLADGPADLGLRAHAGIGGVGPLEISRVRLGRDVLYDASGTHGGGAGFHLGPDEFFVLGDNPPFSRDSRHYGAVPRDRIVGVVRRRLWPGGWTERGWSRD
jgi:signal peptidase I